MYVYARFHEPIYDVPQSAVDIHVIFNSAATFGMVILFMYLFHNVAVRSEEKLEKQATVDNLTGLYNRHYLLAALDQAEGGSISITVTIGVSKYAEGMTNDGWISQADEKLYYGKKNGKNQVVA